MNMSDSNARYHIVPRVSVDSDHEESSPNEQLLPSPVTSLRFRGSGEWKVDIQPVFWLRIFSTICALTAFIIFVISGGSRLIAADVFLMMIIILNILQVINHCLTHLLKVSIELRRRSRSVSLGSDVKPRISMYFDVGLSLALMIALAVGITSINAHYWRYRRGSWKIGEGFAWVVFGVQLVLAIPQLANKRLLLTAKLSDLKDTTYTPDIKIPTPMVSSPGNKKASPGIRAAQTQVADDLV